MFISLASYFSAGNRCGPRIKQSFSSKRYQSKLNLQAIIKNQETGYINVTINQGDNFELHASSGTVNTSPCCVKTKEFTDIGDCVVLFVPRGQLISTQSVSTFSQAFIREHSVKRNVYVMNGKS